MLREVPCRSCRGMMVFVKVDTKPKKGETEPGHRVMPLDAKPSPEGRWFINENEGDGSRDDPHKAYYTRTDDADFRKRHDANLLHTPHHATCPDAESFRKKKG
jgi:hypothetical protein